LDGTIPSGINLLTSMNYLNVSMNKLTGSLPELGSLTQLKTLDISFNQLSGSLPSSLSLLTSLTIL